MYACSDRFGADAKASSSLGDGHTNAFVWRLVVRLDAVITLHIDGSVNHLKVGVQGGSSRPLDVGPASGAGHKRVAVKRWFRPLTQASLHSRSACIAYGGAMK